jgi:hypothetical protein
MTRLAVGALVCKNYNDGVRFCDSRQIAQWRPADRHRMRPRPECSSCNRPRSVPTTTIGCGLLCLLPTGRTRTFTLPIYLPQASGRGAHARFGRCAPLLDSACSLMACNLGSCCVHWHSESFGSRADRSPHEGASGSCATIMMSSHTCYRAWRSLHFPLAFGAVCSLSGTQPKFSLGRLPHT